MSFSLISKNINIEKFDSSKKFDIIFLDPPFADNDYLKNLSLIKTLYYKNTGTFIEIRLVLFPF